jgi:hypothetical protein
MHAIRATVDRMTQKPAVRHIQTRVTPETYAKAEARRRELGLSMTDYLIRLIEDDHRQTVEPKARPVPVPLTKENLTEDGRLKQKHGVVYNVPEPKRRRLPS